MLGGGRHLLAARLMPEPTQFNFSYKEVLVALVKLAGLREGKWQLLMNFGFAATNMGPTEAEAVPGAAVAVTGIGLAKATDGSPKALVIDAAEVAAGTEGESEAAS